MNDKQHAAILSAYINRLTIGDIQALAAAQFKCLTASMNNGLSAQCDTQAAADALVLQSVQKLMDSDKENIAHLVAAALAK